MRRVTLCLLLAAPTLAANLVPDPSCENGQWELANWMPCETVKDFSGPAHTGQHALHLKGVAEQDGKLNTLGISPVFEVAGDTDYLLSVWYRTAAETRPTLCFMTFSQPFATQDWKTPKPQYLSRAIAPSTTWKLASWRFKAAPTAVEMRVLLRLNQVGEVWFDDVSVSKVEPDALELLEPGSFVSATDRQLHAKVGLPAGTAWRLSLAAEQPLASTAGNGPMDATLRYQSDAGADLVLLLENPTDGGLLDVAEVTPPPLLELSLQDGRYRRSLYLGSGQTAFTGKLVVHATPALKAKLQMQVALGQTQGSPNPNGEFICQAPRQPGDYELVARVEGTDLDQTARLPVKVVAASPEGHEVIVDRFNRLVVDGKPFYPHGFYGVPDQPEHAKYLADAGFNMALTYGRGPEGQVKWLDTLQAAGLKGIVHVPWTPAPEVDLAKVREGIAMVKGHPALLGYYIIDEPSPSRTGQTPEEVRRVYQAVVAEDPYHPVTICINNPSNEAPYADCADVMMIDAYPLVANRKPLGNVFERMRHAVDAVRDESAVWNIPQTFGWDVIEGLDRPANYLTPQPDQMAALYYHALTAGARGMVGYCYHVYTKYDPEKKKAGAWPWTLGGYLPDQQPALWGALVKLAGEVSKLEPWLLAEATVSETIGQVNLLRCRRDGQTAILLENVSEDQPVVLDLLVPEWTATSARSLWGDQQYPIKAGKLRVELPPNGHAALVERR